MVLGYTTIEQSRKLAEILPVESADMWWAERYTGQVMENGQYIVEKNPVYYPSLTKPSNDNYSQDVVKDIPCWGLAALIEQMPSDIKGHELTIRKSYWQIEKTFAFELSYEENFEDYPPSILVSTSSIELIDACVEMILKLKEKNLL